MNSKRIINFLKDCLKSTEKGENLEKTETEYDNLLKGGGEFA